MIIIFPWYHVEDHANNVGQARVRYSLMFDATTYHSVGIQGVVNKPLAIVDSWFGKALIASVARH